MEYIECLDKKQYYTTIHIVEKEPEKKEIRHIHSTKVDADMTQYHIYSLEWTPNSLVFKLDGQHVYQLNKSEAEFWPFDAPYYLILGLTYGNWGGECGMDESILPCEMLVDWVKYYKLKF
jgi:beta-glucanase (GH16 family)